MPNQSKEQLVQSSLVKADAYNSLESSLASLLMDIKLKGRHITDTNSLYDKAAGIVYGDSYIATGIFRGEKGILG